MAILIALNRTKTTKLKPKWKTKSKKNPDDRLITKTVTLLNKSLLKKNNAAITRSREPINGIVPKTEEKITERIKDKNRISCVVVDENRILGYGSVKGSEITAIYVSPERTRTGVGSKILSFLEKEALKMGIKALKLDSSITAFKFYQKHGYKKVKDSYHISDIGKIPCVEMDKVIKE